VLATGADWVPFLITTQARSLNGYIFIDNDKDGITDDIEVISDRAIFALNFQKKGIYPASGPAQTPTPATGGSLKVNQSLRWEPTDGLHACSGYDIYLGTSLTAVTGATRTSPEFKGNQGDPLYLPRPALSAGKTYFWRVDTVSPWGKVTKGPIWTVRVVL
jgi:hypothetical protein